ncbi:MAG: cytochrome c [Rhizobiaceae bacterium]
MMKKSLIGVILMGALAYWGYTNFFTANEVATGAPLVAVTVPTLSADDKLGETAFNENCATCHGENAAGQDGVAPPLVHKIYEPNHHGDMAFVMAAKRGTRQHHWRFGNMPPQPQVTEEEMIKIITYVRTLQRANGIN